MKVKISVLFIFFALIVTPAFASVWDGAGLTQVSEGVEDDKKTVTLQNESGAQFKVIYSADVSDKQAAKIADVAGEITGWKTIPLNDLRFFISDKTIDVVVSPVKIEINKTNFLSYFPSGLFFFVDLNDYILRYDFRMNYKGNLFLRVKGIYVNETELRKQIESAVANPKAYIKTGDLEYLVNKLEDLEAKVALLKYDLYAIQEENFRLKAAVVSLQNRSFFGDVFPVPIETVTKVVEFKKENPSMNKDQIQKEMEKQGVKVSGNEVFLILSVYFNEYK
ncbi:MAG: hypothetical protein A2014_03765 [Spirochaetes bacterium GWF1_49_6]|nr:MAG: hypothetical protein A2014_03765 [Spirochaetes bacterium GWF1_49_6]